MPDAPGILHRAMSPRNAGRAVTQASALLLSILIEAPVAAALVGGLGWGCAGRAGWAAALGTAMTHPVAWPAILWCSGMIGYWPGLLVTEGGVVLAESLAYYTVVPMPAGRALLASLVANAASTVAGLLLYAFGRA